jgi:hypothetical protein
MIGILIPGGLESALIGYTIDQPGRPSIAILDFQKCINILVKQDGMTPEDANEFLMYNVIDARVGERTPGFVEVINTQQ